MKKHLFSNLTSGLKQKKKATFLFAQFFILLALLFSVQNVKADILFEANPETIIVEGEAAQFRAIVTDNITTLKILSPGYDQGWEIVRVKLLLGGYEEGVTGSLLGEFTNLDNNHVHIRNIALPSGTAAQMELNGLDMYITFGTIFNGPIHVVMYMRAFGNADDIEFAVTRRVAISINTQGGAESYNTSDRITSLFAPQILFDYPPTMGLIKDVMSSRDYYIEQTKVNAYVRNLFVIPTMDNPADCGTFVVDHITIYTDLNHNGIPDIDEPGVNARFAALHPIKLIPYTGSVEITPSIDLTPQERAAHPNACYVYRITSSILEQLDPLLTTFEGTGILHYGQRLIIRESFHLTQCSIEETVVKYEARYGYSQTSIDSTAKAWERPIAVDTYIKPDWAIGKITKVGENPGSYDCNTDCSQVGSITVKIENLGPNVTNIMTNIGVHARLDHDHTNAHLLYRWKTPYRSNASGTPIGGVPDAFWLGIVEDCAKTSEIFFRCNPDIILRANETMYVTIPYEVCLRSKVYTDCGLPVPTFICTPGQDFLSPLVNYSVDLFYSNNCGDCCRYDAIDPKGKWDDFSPRIEARFPFREIDAPYPSNQIVSFLQHNGHNWASNLTGGYHSVIMTLNDPELWGVKFNPYNANIYPSFQDSLRIYAGEPGPWNPNYKLIKVLAPGVSSSIDPATYGPQYGATLSVLDTVDGSPRYRIVNWYHAENPTYQLVFACDSSIDQKYAEVKFEYEFCGNLYGCSSVFAGLISNHGCGYPTFHITDAAFVRDTYGWADGRTKSLRYVLSHLNLNLLPLATGVRTQAAGPNDNLYFTSRTSVRWSIKNCGTTCDPIFSNCGDCNDPAPHSVTGYVTCDGDDHVCERDDTFKDCMGRKWGVDSIPVVTVNSSDKIDYMLSFSKGNSSERYIDLRKEAAAVKITFIPNSNPCATKALARPIGTTTKSITFPWDGENNKRVTMIPDTTLEEGVYLRSPFGGHIPHVTLIRINNLQDYFNDIDFPKDLYIYDSLVVEILLRTAENNLPIPKKDLSHIYTIWSINQFDSAGAVTPSANPYNFLYEYTSGCSGHPYAPILRDYDRGKHFDSKRFVLPDFELGDYRITELKAGDYARIYYMNDTARATLFKYVLKDDYPGKGAAETYTNEYRPNMEMENLQLIFDHPIVLTKLQIRSFLSREQDSILQHVPLSWLDVVYSNGQTIVTLKPGYKLDTEVWVRGDGFLVYAEWQALCWDHPSNLHVSFDAIHYPTSEQPVIERGIKKDIRMDVMNIPYTYAMVPENITCRPLGKTMDWNFTLTNNSIWRDYDTWLPNAWMSFRSPASIQPRLIQVYGLITDVDHVTVIDTSSVLHTFSAADFYKYRTNTPAVSGEDDDFYDEYILKFTDGLFGAGNDVLTGYSKYLFHLEYNYHPENDHCKDLYKLTLNFANNKVAMIETPTTGWPAFDQREMCGPITKMALYANPYASSYQAIINIREPRVRYDFCGDEVKVEAVFANAMPDTLYNIVLELACPGFIWNTSTIRVASWVSPDAAESAFTSLSTLGGTFTLSPPKPGELYGSSLRIILPADQYLLGYYWDTCRTGGLSPNQYRQFLYIRAEGTPSCGFDRNKNFIDGMFYAQAACGEMLIENRESKVFAINGLPPSLSKSSIGMEPWGDNTYTTVPPFRLPMNYPIQQSNIIYFGSTVTGAPSSISYTIKADLDTLSRFVITLQPGLELVACLPVGGVWPKNNTPLVFSGTTGKITADLRQYKEMSGSRWVIPRDKPSQRMTFEFYLIVRIVDRNLVFNNPDDCTTRAWASFNAEVGEIVPCAVVSGGECIVWQSFDFDRVYTLEIQNADVELEKAPNVNITKIDGSNIYFEVQNETGIVRNPYNLSLYGQYFIDMNGNEEYDPGIDELLSIDPPVSLIPLVSGIPIMTSVAPIPISYFPRFPISPVPNVYSFKVSSLAKVCNLMFMLKDELMCKPYYAKPDIKYKITGVQPGTICQGGDYIIVGNPDDGSMANYHWTVNPGYPITRTIEESPKKGQAQIKYIDMSRPPLTDSIFAKLEVVMEHCDNISSNTIGIRVVPKPWISYPTSLLDMVVCLGKIVDVRFDRQASSTAMLDFINTPGRPPFSLPNVNPSPTPPTLGDYIRLSGTVDQDATQGTRYYSIRITEMSGICAGIRDTVHGSITVLGKATIKTHYSDTTLCAGTALHLAPIIDVPDGVLVTDYIWEISPNGVTSWTLLPVPELPYYYMSPVNAALDGKFIRFTIKSRNAACKDLEHHQILAIRVMGSESTANHIQRTSNTPFTVCEGDSIRFTGPALAGATYEWKVSVNDTTSWSYVMPTSPPKNGKDYKAKTSTTAFPGSATGNKYYFRRVISELCDGSESNIDSVIVYKITVANEILPKTDTICVGGSLQIYGNDIKTTNPGSYQWEYSPPAAFSIIADSVGQNYWATNITSNRSYRRTFILKDTLSLPHKELCRVSSNTASITVFNPTSNTIATGPIVMCAGTPVTTTQITAPNLTTSYPTVKYLWLRKVNSAAKWDTIPGATSYTFPSNTPSQTHGDTTYYCRIANVGDCIDNYSNIVAVYVYNTKLDNRLTRISDPVICNQAGADLRISIKGLGIKPFLSLPTPPITKTITWYKRTSTNGGGSWSSNATLTNGGYITRTDTTLVDATPLSTTITTIQYWRAVAIDSCTSSAPSDTITITVNQPPTSTGTATVLTKCHKDTSFLLEGFVTDAFNATGLLWEIFEEALPDTIPYTGSGYLLNASTKTPTFVRSADDSDRGKKIIFRLKLLPKATCDTVSKLFTLILLAEPLITFPNPDYMCRIPGTPYEIDATAANVSSVEWSMLGHASLGSSYFQPGPTTSSEINPKYFPSNIVITTYDSVRLNLHYVATNNPTCANGDTVLIVRFTNRPTMLQPDSIEVCNGEKFSVEFETDDVIEPTYEWTITSGNAAALGLLTDSGTGDLIDIETAIIYDGKPVTVVFKVTPTHGSCEGVSKYFTVKVIPGYDLELYSGTPPAGNLIQTVCRNSDIKEIFIGTYAPSDSIHFRGSFPTGVESKITPLTNGINLITIEGKPTSIGVFRDTIWIMDCMGNIVEREIVFTVVGVPDLDPILPPAVACEGSPLVLPTPPDIPGGASGDWYIETYVNSTKYTVYSPIAALAYSDSSRHLKYCASYLSSCPTDLSCTTPVEIAVKKTPVLQCYGMPFQSCSGAPLAFMENFGVTTYPIDSVYIATGPTCLERLLTVPTVVPTSTTRYCVTIYSGGCASNSCSVTVMPYVKPVFGPESPKVVCEDQIYTLITSPPAGTTISWRVLSRVNAQISSTTPPLSPGIGTLYNGNPTHKLLLTSTSVDTGYATYRVYATSADGCKDSLDLTVKALQHLTLTLVKNSATICYGSNFDLSTVVPPLPPASDDYYTYTGTANKFVPIVVQPSVGTHTYYITLTSAYCTVDVPFTLRVIDEVSPPTAQSPQHFCDKGSPTVAELVVYGNADVTWYDAPYGGNIVTLSTPLVHEKVYYAAQNVATCQSILRTPVLALLDSLLVVPPINEIQYFCAGATIADLQTNGDPKIRWHDDSDPLSTPLPSTDLLTDGASYYAFVHSGTGPDACVSDDYVTVVVHENPPVINPNIPDQRFCVGATIANILVPNNLNVVWFETATSTTPIDPSELLTAKSYYAAISHGENCVNPFRQKVEILINTANPPQVVTPQEVCVDATFGYLQVLGYGVEWYDAASGGNLISPSTIIPSGTHTYWAQERGNSACPSTRVPVEVKTNLCKVKLNLKLFLEGVTKYGPYQFKGETRNGPYMTNLLQVHPMPTARLPETNPYGLPEVYPQINNPAGPANKVVDWIKVEIWGNVSDITLPGPYTYTLLEERALLLQIDGSVVDVNGQLPKFDPQTDYVRIVVKHRNHLSVMSSDNEMLFNTEVVTYDFTTGTNKAAQFSAEPDPMIIFNTVYCLYAGDLDQDGLINAKDANLYQSLPASGYGYHLSDVDMNGMKASADNGFIVANLNKRSPLIYFNKN